jgi:hypothetical protein
MMWQGRDGQHSANDAHGRLIDDIRCGATRIEARQFRLRPMACLVRMREDNIPLEPQGDRDR